MLVGLATPHESTPGHGQPVLEFGQSLDASCQDACVMWGTPEFTKSESLAEHGFRHSFIR